MNSIFSEKNDMYTILPVIETWLYENGFNVTVIANRIDAAKNGNQIWLLIENYPPGCLIKVYSPIQFYDDLRKYLTKKKCLTYKISCSYCGREFNVDEKLCPFCGASSN